MRESNDILFFPSSSKFKYFLNSRGSIDHFRALLKAFYLWMAFSFVQNARVLLDFKKQFWRGAETTYIFIFFQKYFEVGKRRWKRISKNGHHWSWAQRLFYSREEIVFYGVKDATVYIVYYRIWVIRNVSPQKHTYNKKKSYFQVF